MMQACAATACNSATLRSQPGHSRRVHGIKTSKQLANSFQGAKLLLKQHTDSQMVDRHIATSYKILDATQMQRLCFMLHTGMAICADASLCPLSATCAAAALGF